MRDPERIDIILSKLKTVWSEMPDIRLSQLIVNLIKEDRHPEPTCPKVFYYEDDDLERMLEKYMYGNGR